MVTWDVIKSFVQNQEKIVHKFVVTGYPFGFHQDIMGSGAMVEYQYSFGTSTRISCLGDVPLEGARKMRIWKKAGVLDIQEPFWRIAIYIG